MPVGAQPRRPAGRSTRAGSMRTTMTGAPELVDVAPRPGTPSRTTPPRGRRRGSDVPRSSTRAMPAAPWRGHRLGARSMARTSQRGGDRRRPMPAPASAGGQPTAGAAADARGRQRRRARRSAASSCGCSTGPRGSITVSCGTTPLPATISAAPSASSAPPSVAPETGRRVDDHVGDDEPDPGSPQSASRPADDAPRPAGWRGPAGRWGRPAPSAGAPRAGSARRPDVRPAGNGGSLTARVRSPISRATSSTNGTATNHTTMPSGTGPMWPMAQPAAVGRRLDVLHVAGDRRPGGVGQLRRG